MLVSSWSELNRDSLVRLNVVQPTLSKLIVEIDAQIVVNQWNSAGTGRSEVATTLNEVRELYRNFEEFRLKFMSRESNELAHMCAKQCNSSRRRCIWINYISSFLTTCVLKECNPAS